MPEGTTNSEKQDPSRKLSKSQINRFGDRLRRGNVTDEDLRLLDSYRLSFGPACDAVVETIRTHLNLEPAVRPAKSRTSIIDKLRREKTRLSQMQDIAGCRVVVTDLPTQDQVVARLQQCFERASVIDRRTKPSHGYRAVHIIAEMSGSSVEIQVRTSLQHWWAELSEKFADLVDPEIKYGRGDEDALDSLAVASEEVIRVEDAERSLMLLTEIRAELARRGEMSEDIGRQILEAQRAIAARRKNVIRLIAGMGEIVPEEN